MATDNTPVHTPTSSNGDFSERRPPLDEEDDANDVAMGPSGRARPAAVANHDDDGDDEDDFLRFRVDDEPSPLERTRRQVQALGDLSQRVVAENGHNSVDEETARAAGFIN